MKRIGYFWWNLEEDLAFSHKSELTPGKNLEIARASHRRKKRLGPSAWSLLFFSRNHAATFLQFRQFFNSDDANIFMALTEERPPKHTIQLSRLSQG